MSKSMENLECHLKEYESVGGGGAEENSKRSQKQDISTCQSKLNKDESRMAVITIKIMLVWLHD